MEVKLDKVTLDVSDFSDSSDSTRSIELDLELTEQLILDEIKEDYAYFYPFASLAANISKGSKDYIKGKKLIKTKHCKTFEIITYDLNVREIIETLDPNERIDTIRFVYSNESVECVWLSELEQDFDVEPTVEGNHKYTLFGREGER